MDTLRLVTALPGYVASTFLTNPQRGGPVEPPPPAGSASVQAPPAPLGLDRDHIIATAVNDAAEQLRNGWTVVEVATNLNDIVTQLRATA